ncbi:TonB-dependent siderophore receptor [Pseudomonas abieticivorans]|uniref:TonB-dependent siderophore receptor n=1 Tax=Pseudomonas abieticivorans TaxID=2931382 RepID=UPI0020C04C70|nr:TonB-dependent siderophore receptor [Pseudomonas sp. PIA16]
MQQPFKRAALSLALRATCGLALATSPIVHAASQSATQAYRIPAGPLGQALTRFSDQSGLRLIVDSQLLAGRSSPGLNGQYSVAQGVQQLLAGTGLAASLSGDTLAIEKATVAGDAMELGATRINSEQMGSTTEGTGSYTTGAVTLGKGAQKLKDIPQSVSVLTRQRMDDQNIVTLKQALENSTGISAIKSPGSGLFIYSRGFDIEAIQYDGVPVPRNLYSLGSYISENMAIYDRMEVLRGAAGLLQGANSPGGAINMVRKRPQAEPTVTLTATGGSWDRYGTQLDAGGKLNDAGTVRGRAVVDYQKGNSFTDSIWNWEQTVYGALDFDLDADTTLGVGAGNKYSHYQPYMIGLPRNSDGSRLDLGRSTYAGANWNRAFSNQTSIYLDLEHRFNEAWKLKASALGMVESNEATYQFITGTVSPTSRPIYADYGTDFQNHNLGLDAYLDGQFQGLGFMQSLVLGANYSKFTTDDGYARAFTPGVDINNIDHDRPFQSYDSIASSANLTHSQYDVRQKGVYGSWRVNLLEPLTLVLGGRVSWYSESYDADNYFQGQPNGDPTHSTSQSSGKVTPYAGLVYALNEQWSAYASYADVFVPQSELTQAKTALKPITGTNYEVGLKGELMDGRLNTSLAVFRYIQKNRAVSDLSTDIEDPLTSCDGWYCSLAAGKVRSQGVELELNGELLPGLQLSSGYTYNTTTFLDDPDYQGKVFSTFTPKHLLRVWANYALPGDFERVSVGAGVNSQSRTQSFDRAYEEPGFSIWSARVGYKVSDQVSLAANLNNLFDKHYVIPSYGSLTGNNYFGDPRNVMFTVKYTPTF